MEQFYFIYSFEHKAWWGEKHNGYVEHVYGAGQYTFEEAFAICESANAYSKDMPNEVMVPEF